MRLVLADSAKLCLGFHVDAELRLETPENLSKAGGRACICTLVRSRGPLPGAPDTSVGFKAI